MCKPNIILCDIDGTVADLSHRRHWIDPEIKVGDIVRPVGIPNAKDHKGIVRAHWPAKQFVNEEQYVVEWSSEPHGMGPLIGKCSPTSIKKSKRWDKFFENVDKDTPIWPTIDIINSIASKPWFKIVFMSGRPERLRKATLTWLANNVNHYLADTDKLFMRPDNDTREDYIVKKELYLTHVEPHYNVVAVFDDRKQVVDMWRSLGLTCYQVAEGNF
jgi:hypothetical protein